MNVRMAALCAAFFTPVPGTAQVSPKHDGRWTVQVVTEQGWCGAHQWQIGVRGGRVTEVGAPDVTASGGIDPKGSVSIQIARGADVLQATGMVTNRSGGGAWTLPSRSCAAGSL